MDFKKIIMLAIVALATMSFSVPSHAQLINKKRGTIKEQIEKSTLFGEEEVEPIIAEMHSL